MSMCVASALAPCGYASAWCESVRQSMDGHMMVVEQDRMLYERKLARCLLPGPLTYCAKGDFLLTYASRMEVECYKYSCNLAGGSGGGAGATRKLLAHRTVHRICHALLHTAAGSRMVLDLLMRCARRNQHDSLRRLSWAHR